MRHSSTENRYLAHSLLRLMKQPDSTVCGFIKHTLATSQPPLAQWELCMLQDLSQVNPLLAQGIDLDSVNQTLWDEGCKAQDTLGIRRYQTIYCCETCAGNLLLAHTNEPHVAQNARTFARTHHYALLLVSDRLNQLPVVITNLPADIQEADLWRYL